MTPSRVSTTATAPAATPTRAALCVNVSRPVGGCMASLCCASWTSGACSYSFTLMCNAYMCNVWRKDATRDAGTPGRRNKVSAGASPHGRDVDCRPVRGAGNCTKLGALRRASCRTPRFAVRSACRRRVPLALLQAKERTHAKACVDLFISLLYMFQIDRDTIRQFCRGTMALVARAARAAYIAVDHAIVSTVLREGYIASRRRFVPHAPSPQLAAQAFMKYNPTCQKVVVLEINGGPPVDTKVIEQTRLQQTNPCDGCGGICFGPAKTGIVQLCKGLSAKQSKDRENRLKSNVKTLYHQTSQQNAENILSKPMPVLLRGQSGLVDGGIYFAVTPDDTHHKALAQGVIHKCKVRLGKLKKINKAQDNT
eukprot:5782890-Prymnesium_polylepis.1